MAQLQDMVWKRRVSNTKRSNTYQQKFFSYGVLRCKNALQCRMPVRVEATVNVESIATLE